jgi:hypothetical protein
VYFNRVVLDFKLSRLLNVICLLLGNEDGAESVPKRWHTKFRRRGNYLEESIQLNSVGLLVEILYLFQLLTGLRMTVLTFVQIFRMNDLKMSTVFINGYITKSH